MWPVCLYYYDYDNHNFVIQQNHWKRKDKVLTRNWMFCHTQLDDSTNDIIRLKVLKLVNENHHHAWGKLIRCPNSNFLTWHGYVWSFGICQVLHFLWQVKNYSVSMHQSATIHKSSRGSKVLWNLTRNVCMKISLSKHNLVATFSQEMTATPQIHKDSQHSMLQGLVVLITISSFIWTIHNTYI